MEWQPIETAPKDNRLFLAFAPEGCRILIVRGSILTNMMHASAPAHLKFPATHWMPLPEPMKTESTDE